MYEYDKIMIWMNKMNTWDDWMRWMDERNGWDDWIRWNEWMSKWDKGQKLMNDLNEQNKRIK